MRPFQRTDRISRHFTYHEALWLPKWGRLANEGDGLTDDVLNNVEFLLSKVDVMLDDFAWRAIVHCCYRPVMYNKLVGGANNSAHLANRIHVAAIDFHVEDVACEDARKLIVASGHLDELGLRLEDNGPAAPWLHLDSAPVPAGGHRYFKP